jgi:hypothetical protein
MLPNSGGGSTASLLDNLSHSYHPSAIFSAAINSTDNNNTDNVTSIPVIEMPLDIIFYGSFFYTIIFLIGALGNLMVIYVLMKEKELRSFTNYLLANLSIADIMVLFTCVPSAFHDLYAKERWYLGKLMCYLIFFIENCVGIASILSLLLITLERYYAICQPLKVKSVMTQSRTLKLILLIWCLAILINLPVIYLTEYSLGDFYDNTVEYKCTIKELTKVELGYYVFVSFVSYFLIGLVLLVMYYKISMYLRKSTLILISMNKEW